jgi:hypothetical protein
MTELETTEDIIRATKQENTGNGDNRPPCDCGCHCTICILSDKNQDWNTHFNLCRLDPDRPKATHELVFTCPNCKEHWQENTETNCITDCWKLDTWFDCPWCRYDQVPSPLIRRIPRLCNEDWIFLLVLGCMDRRIPGARAVLGFH